MEMQKVSNHYDYIIAGAGASGLSLAWHMLQSPLAKKRVLIIDTDLEPKHDKTWCFWDTVKPPFSDIIHKEWKQAEVRAHGKRLIRPLNSHSYYCIRSIDFQNKILSAVKDSTNFDILQSTVNKLTSSVEKSELHADGQKISAQYIFQSCFTPTEIQHSDIQYSLLQHFLGWEIRTQKLLFDAKTFTLMDFDETFTDGIAFIYLLPWTSQSGLVEYTIFSDKLLAKEKYEEKISQYLHDRFNLKSIDYTIQREEYGQIPMQDRPYVPWFKPRILNIGTQGGMTKPSTGYTFTRIQQQVETIVDQLVMGHQPQGNPPSKSRFKAYDLWLLHIISNNPDEAQKIFYALFENNTMDEVFRFLSERTTLKEDLKIMSSVPSKPFVQALWKTKTRLRKL